MPRPRDSTEMRPSIPARKRWPCLNGALFSCAARSGSFLPPRCGMDTTLTPLRSQDFMFCSAKATARSSARKDLQHLGSPPPMPTASWNHSCVASQPSSGARSARRQAGSTGRASSPPSCRSLLRDGLRIGLQEQLVELAGLALGGGDAQELAGHVHEGAQIPVYG